MSEKIEFGSSSVDAPRKVNMERWASGVIIDNTFPVGEVETETRDSTLHLTIWFSKVLPYSSLPLRPINLASPPRLPTPTIVLHAAPPGTTMGVLPDFDKSPQNPCLL